MTSYPTVERSCRSRPVDSQIRQGAWHSRSWRLESALARPQSGYYTDLAQEAAALWESLSQNHPFVDGNKRVAVTTMAAFLRINGYRLEFDDLDAFSILLGLYDRGPCGSRNSIPGCASMPCWSIH